VGNGLASPERVSVKSREGIAWKDYHFVTLILSLAVGIPVNLWLLLVRFCHRGTVSLAPLSEFPDGSIFFGFHRDQLNYVFSGMLRGDKPIQWIGYHGFSSYLFTSFFFSIGLNSFGTTDQRT
jgi:hypothetical protein